MTFDLDVFLKPSNKWDRKYLKEVTSAIRKYQPEKADEIIQRYLSEESQGELNLTNPYSRRYSAPHYLPQPEVWKLIFFART
jgi:hypothetical protein